MTGNKLASIFDIEPQQWGLRGDPYLWKEMKEKIASIEIYTSIELEKLLYDLFFEFTKSKPEKGLFIFVDRYNFGGMSTGRVSSDFWTQTAFPLLIDRFKDLNGESL